jgi:DnaK suppressor protein
VAKKTPQARKASSGKASTGSKASAKPASKPAAKAAAKPASKPAAKPIAKPAAKPPSKVVAKAAVKAPVKAASKPVAKPMGKVPAKAAIPAKAMASKTVPGKPAPGKAQPGAKVAAAAKGAPVVADDKKGGKKGITVVDPKAAAKKPKPKEKPTSVAPPSVGRLLDPKNPMRRPLIPSGPKAAHIRPLGMQGPEEERPVVSGKSPFGKRELAQFRQVLIRKRAELVGDVSQMENEALQGNAGTTSVPQHMAEQGSDTYDQSLALDIAAADRKLIKEIDDAIKRIDEGTFGICELTGKPIKTERLEELPWARYSIEAARELERRSMWA